MREQIELLKDDAHSFTTKLVPRHGAQSRQVMSQDLTNTLLHWLYTGQQGQQGAFTATTGPLNEQVFTQLQLQFFYLDER